MEELKIELTHSFKTVLSDAAFQLFEVLVNCAEDIKYFSYGYEVVFPNPSEDYEDFIFTILNPLKYNENATPPQKVNYNQKIDRIKKSPESFQKFMAVCNGFEWGTVGDVDQLILHNGYEGTLHVMGQDVFGNTIEYNENIFAPIDIGLQAFYFIHPETNRLCLHDELMQEVKDTDDPIEVYLRELHYELNGFSLDESFNDVFKDATNRRAWLNSIS